MTSVLKPVDLEWPACGERRREVRKNPRNQFEQQLAESLRGQGNENFYNVKPKKLKSTYDWNEPNL